MAGVELGDGADAGTAVQQAVPVFFSSVPQGADDADSCDDDSISLLLTLNVLELSSC